MIDPEATKPTRCFNFAEFWEAETIPAERCRYY
jgi:hypothetical protein